jgi:hypothetical protein
VVTFKRVNLPLVKVLLHVVEKELLVALLVRHRVVPLVMGRYVASPEESVRAHSVNLLSHFVEDRDGNVTEAK